MALAEKVLAAQFNRPGHASRSITSDLCLPGRWLPDGRDFPRGLLPGGHPRASASSSPSTMTTASPSTGRSEGWFTDDTPGPDSEAYGWHVIRRRRRARPGSGHVASAIEEARGQGEKPASLICCPHGHRQGCAPNKEGTEAPRPTARRWGRTRLPPRARRMGWDHGPFEIPDPISTPAGNASGSKAPPRESDVAASAIDGLQGLHTRNWRTELERRLAGELPAGFRRRGPPSTLPGLPGGRANRRRLPQGLAE